MAYGITSWQAAYENMIAKIKSKNFSDEKLEKIKAYQIKALQWYDEKRRYDPFGSRRRLIVSAIKAIQFDKRQGNRSCLKR